VNPDSDTRALGAVSDLNELLRLAASAAERATQETFGPTYEHAELIARDLQRLRRSAEKLQRAVEAFVHDAKDIRTQGGHPLRRASDRGSQHSQ
jgi:hypothetical protein